MVLAPLIPSLLQLMANIRHDWTIQQACLVILASPVGCLPGTRKQRFHQLVLSCGNAGASWNTRLTSDRWAASLPCAALKTIVAPNASNALLLAGFALPLGMRGMFWPKRQSPSRASWITRKLLPRAEGRGPRREAREALHQVPKVLRPGVAHEVLLGFAQQRRAPIERTPPKQCRSLV